MRSRLLPAMAAALCSLFVVFAGIAAAAPAKPGHVFIIVLENEGFGYTFGPKSPATYLNGLARQGALLNQYHGNRSG